MNKITRLKFPSRVWCFNVTCANRSQLLKGWNHHIRSPAMNSWRILVFKKWTYHHFLLRKIRVSSANVIVPKSIHLDTVDFLLFKPWDVWLIEPWKYKGNLRCLGVSPFSTNWEIKKSRSKSEICCKKATSRTCGKFWLLRIIGSSPPLRFTTTDFVGVNFQ